MKIYISGPIMYDTSEKDYFDTTRAIIEALGHEAVNPKNVEACEDGDCFKLPHEYDKDMKHSWSCFMRYDLIEMLQCDAIAMIPGWQDSHGARLEHQVAVATGLAVYKTNGMALVRL